MATITSAGTGNSDATATWVGGVVPDADDDVVIDSGHTVTQNANATFNSLAVNGTFVASSSYSLTIDGERSNGRALDIVGTFTHGNGTITITTAADTDLRWPSSSEAYNITINHASCIARPTGDKPVIANNLTITAGEYNTLDAGGSTNHALTVEGATTIGDGSSSADTATLTCNASTISLGSGVTGAHSLVVQAGGTFTGGTGTHTLGSLNIKNSTAAKCTLSSGNTTINGEHGSSSKAINIEGSNGTTNFAHGSGTVIITFNGSSDIKADGVTLNLNNLTINHADADINTKSNLTCAGDVTISAGILDGEDDAISFGSLTISGGTYNATSGTTTITNRKSGEFSLSNAGTFANNDGTVLFNSAFDQHVSFTGTGNMHHCTVNKSDNDLVQRSNLTIEGDLDITTASGHDFRSNNGTHTLDVTGNVTLSAGRFGGNTTYTANHSYGGLEIASGAEWRATSGTTTITDKISSGSYTNYMFQNAGTFTHNKGTVHWKADTSSGTWYAMNGSSSATETEFYNISTERVRASGTEQYRFWVGGSGRHLTVLNNIDIGANTRIFSSNGTGNFKHLGNCYLRGTSGGLNLDNVTTVNIGTVTIESGATLEFADGNSINVEGIRNIGGTVTAT